MANKISTVRTYPLNGAVNFTITFEYLARKFVKVTLIGKDRKELVLNQDYRFTTKTQITTSRAWTAADGYNMIEIRRFTSASDRLVDFADGSILRAYDLNISQIQTLHVADEARDLTADTIGVNNDGNLDARGRRIVNLANAVDDSDAISFGQVKTMNQNSWQARNESLQFRNEAETFRNQAEGFKNESSTNATNTYKWRNEAEGFRDEAEQFKNTATQQATAAGNSADAAHQSEVNAANSATASANSATLAEQQADRAESEADKLGNWNALAGAVQDVVDKDVSWYGGGIFNNGVTIHRASGPQLVIDGSTNQPSYISGQTDNRNSWFVGKANIGSEEVLLHSYDLDTSIFLKSDRITLNKPLNVNGEVRTLNSVLQNDGDIRGGRWGEGSLSATIHRNRVKYQLVFSGTWLQGQTVTFTNATIDQQFLIIGINTGTGIDHVSVCTPSAGSTFWVNIGDWSYRIGMSPDGWRATMHSSQGSSGAGGVGAIAQVYVVRTDLG